MIKWHRTGVEWGGPDKLGQPFWYFFWWNWLRPEHRYFGFHTMWYDGPHASFGFWFFNWSWSTYWTKPPAEFR